MVTVLKSLKFRAKEKPARKDQERVAKELAAILEQARRIGIDHASNGVKRGLTWTQGKNILSDAWAIVSNVIDRIWTWITGQPEPPDEQDIQAQVDTLVQAVADTEVHAEIESAVLDTLQEQGISSIVWMAQPGACPRCQENADEGPIPIGSAFSTGDDKPPAHPRCRCSLGMADDEVSRNATVGKESESLYLFLDLDGVLSIPNAGNPSKIIDGKEAWPIPQSSAFLQAIADAPQVRPIWLTHWGDKANAWNDAADIGHWPVWFPLSAEEEKQAQKIYPDLDRKILAIQYCMHVNAIQSAVWIQDGFAPEEEEWATRAHVRLMNSNKEPLHSLLLSDHANAASELVDALENSTNLAAEIK